MKKTFRIIAKTFFVSLLSLLSIHSTQAQSATQTNTFTVTLDASDSANPVLIWSTEKEVNTSFFVVEYGEDSSHLDQGTTIKAGGSTYRLTEYAFDEIEYTGKPIFVKITLITMEGNTHQVQFTAGSDMKLGNNQTGFITSN